MLEQIAAANGTDKFQHGYCPYYERHFGYIKDDSLRLLEVGVQFGFSLKTWADWMPNAQIVGVDIYDVMTTRPERTELVVSDVKAYTPDEPFDIIIDDGSHTASDMVAAYHRLWPFVKSGGWYVIEDLETQWEPAYEGAQEGSEARSLLYGLLDDAIREHAHEIVEFHAYRQIVFVNKR